MTRQITKEKAQECLAALKEQFKTHVQEGYTFTLHEPGFHADAWTIACEGIENWTLYAFVGGFDEEVYHLAVDEFGVQRAREMAQQKGVPCPAGVFVEAVNHWCVGLYCTDDQSPVTTDERAPLPPTMTYAQFTATHPIDHDGIGAREFAVALTQAPISAIGRVYSVAHGLLISGEPMQLNGPLTRLQAVTLAAALSGIGLYQEDVTPEEAVRTLCNAVLGAFEEEAQAAHYALATVGLRNVPGMPSWMPALLADHDEHHVCEHTLSRVSLALANVRPGVKWRYVAELGYVVYKTTGIASGKDK